MPMPTNEDSQMAFQHYVVDAQRRFQHDQEFPNEPKQIRPGEDVRVTDGKVQVGGQTVVMGINEKILQTLMERNPDLSFALEESFPLKSTYANATPLGPIMELRVQDEQNALTAERAAQSIDYWRTTAQRLQSDPEASGSPETMKSYSKLVVSQGNLFADRKLSAEAEQAYRLATELWPASPEAVFGHVQLLMQQARFDEAARAADAAVKAAPENQAFRVLEQQVKSQRRN
jgi:tetratricopeptide (TPR) repeat protein